MIVRVSSIFPASAKIVWKYVKRGATFKYVACGLLRIENDDALPRLMSEGTEFQVRLRPLSVLPGWHHRIHVTKVDDGAMEFHTRESGGPYTKWNHSIYVVPVGANRTLYTDQIDFSAVRGERIAAIVIRIFFRYRQLRWRSLLRRRVQREAHGKRK